MCITVVSCVLCFTVPKRRNTPASHHPLRPLSQCDSPVFVSDSDDDYNVVVKSTWRTRHSKPKTQSTVNQINALRCDEEDRSPSLPFSSIHSPFSFPPHNTLTSLASPKFTLAVPSKLHESDSSEEEFISLLERLKNKNKFTGTTFPPKSTHGNGFILIIILKLSLAFVFIVVADDNFFGDLNMFLCQFLL